MNMLEHLNNEAYYDNHNEQFTSAQLLCGRYFAEMDSIFPVPYLFAAHPSPLFNNFIDTTYFDNLR